MNGNVANCREKYRIIEIITEQIFLRVARKYCQLAPKIMWVSKIIMEVVETILAHFYHIYCMMNNILYVMSCPQIMYVAKFVILGRQPNFEFGFSFLTSVFCGGFNSNQRCR